MRVLIISDIHANAEALEACMQVFPDCDMVANLGDVVGYGASPNEVVETVRGLDGLIVRGNHDRACAGLSDVQEFNAIAGYAALWTRNELTAENRKWVSEMPTGPISRPDLPGVLFAHGSPRDEDEYILTENVARTSLVHSTVDVNFYGHTHLQSVMSYSNGRLQSVRPAYRSRDELATWEIELEPKTRYLINPGSVGQPRDADWRAAFALYDSEACKLTLYRVPYDVELASQRIIGAGLPERLAFRLHEGR